MPARGKEPIAISIHVCLASNLLGLGHGPGIMFLDVGKAPGIFWEVGDVPDFASASQTNLLAGKFVWWVGVVPDLPNQLAGRQVGLGSKMVWEAAGPALKLASSAQ